MRELREEDFAVLLAGEVMATVDEFVEDGRGVRQVEIAGDNEGVIPPRTVAHKGVTGGDGAGAESAIAQMAEIELAAEWHRKGFSFREFFEGQFAHLLLCVGNAITDAFEEVGQRQLLAGLLDVVEGMSRANIKTDAGNACAVLTTIVLFFEEKGELLESVVRGSVLPRVIIQIAA